MPLIQARTTRLNNTITSPSSHSPPRRLHLPLAPDETISAPTHPATFNPPPPPPPLSRNPSTATQTYTADADTEGFTNINSGRDFHASQQQHNSFTRITCHGYSSKESPDTNMSTAEQQQLPSREELQQRAVEGHPITTDEVSKIAKTEAELTDGRGPIAGGVAATAQSLKAKQEHFVEVASEVSHKPVNEVTKEDAAAVESAEARLLGHRPPKGSTAATIQSIADKNERLMSETKEES